MKYTITLKNIYKCKREVSRFLIYQGSLSLQHARFIIIIILTREFFLCSVYSLSKMICKL